MAEDITRADDGTTGRTPPEIVPKWARPMTRLMAGRRIAIIGATGFIGSHLTERLVAEGARVLAIARTERRLDNLESVKHACDFEMCDLTSRAPLEAAFARFHPDTVFHLAAHPDQSETFAQMAASLSVNALGVVNVLDVSTRAEVELFVYGDSSKVYGNGEPPYRESQPPRPLCSYAIAKGAAWQLCQLSASLGGPRVVGLRPTLVYGPRQNRNVIEYVRECAVAGRAVRLMGGRQTRDPLFIEDAVEAFVQASLRPEAVGHSIPIGGGHEISVLDLVRTVLRVLGIHMEVQESESDARLTEVWRSVCDNVEAKSLLDWQPKVSLADGLARTLRG